MPIISRLSLTARLTLVAIATLCPLAILIIISYAENRSDRHEAGVNSAVLLTESISSTVEGFTRDLESFSLATNLTFSNVPAASLDQQVNPAIGPYLQRLIDEHGSLRALFVTDVNGRVIAAASPSSYGTELGETIDSQGRPQPPRPYITSLKGGADSVWTSGIAGLQSGQQTIVYASKIKSVATGEPYAYLIAAFYPDVLAERITKELPSDANFVLIDRDGTLLFSSSDPKLESSQRELGSSPEVKLALGGATVQLDDQPTPFDQGDRFGALVPVSNLGWVVGFTRPQSALDQTLYEKFLRDLALFGVIGMISLAAFALSARHVSRPIASLSRAASSIAAGNRVDVPPIVGDPDVVRLRDAFQNMAVAVADREDRLQEQARVLSALERVGAEIASQLDYQQAVITVRETGRGLTEAADAVFFYVKKTPSGGYELTTLAGVPAEEHDFPLPKSMAPFHRVLEGQGAVRLDGVETRAGQNGKSNNGDVARGSKSYLAVPVDSKEREVMGALFFAHPEPAHFTQRHEELAIGIASWAAIALENAQLYRTAQAVQEELRQANKSKDEFLGVISHELRTPTTTIYGGVRLLQMRGDKLSDEERKGLIESIAGEANRLVRLIENLLALARLDLGRQIEAQAFAPSEVAWRVIRSFQQQHASRQVEFESEDQIPSVLAEPTYFEQVLMNLLTNADKYSPADQTIEVHAARNDGEVQVTVRDHGPGVPADELPSIFDSFYRSESTAGQAVGHGLGLTVCKRLVEAQSGHIWAKNRPDGGLEVGFAFPIKAKVEDAAPV